MQASAEDAEDTYRPGCVVCINFVQGKATIEGRGRDYPVWRSVAARIEAPLRDAARQHPHATLVLSDMGGLPGMKPLVHAAGQLYFPQARVMNDTQANPDSQRIGQIDDAVSAVQSYQSRLQCVRLIEQGNFMGAWSVSREVAHDLSGDSLWADKLEKLAFLFDGRWRAPARGSESFPEKWLLATPLNYCPRTLLLALRTDAALRRNSLAEAMALSCAIPEAAFFDGISRFLMIQSRQDAHAAQARRTALLEESYMIDSVSGTVVLRGKSSSELRKALGTILEKKMGKPRENEGLSFWPIRFQWDAAGDGFDPRTKKWLSLVDEPQYRTYEGSPFPVLADALKSYCQCLFSEPENGTPRLWDLGQKAWTLQDESELKAAAGHFFTAGLWTRHAKKPPVLSPVLVGALLTALGFAPYEGLFEKIKAGAIELLRGHAMR